MPSGEAELRAGRQRESLNTLAPVWRSPAAKADP
jgi:hypothetical protein